MKTPSVTEWRKNLGRNPRCVCVCVCVCVCESVSVCVFWTITHTHTHSISPEDVFFSHAPRQAAQLRLETGLDILKEHSTLFGNKLIFQLPKS